MGKSIGPIQTPASPTPAQIPQTTPQAFAPADHSFVLQSVMEMQKTLGQLTQAVTTLTEVSKKSKEDLSEVSKDIHAAKVSMKIICAIVSVVGSGVAIVFWKILEAILPMIQLKPHP
jgi:flagellar hook-basal body complex protein FliE